MSELNQLLLDFDHKIEFNEHDYYVSSSNYLAFNLIQNWPKWERKFVNIIGEELSGKTHLMNIFLKRNRGLKFDANSLKNFHLKKIKMYDNIILENLTNAIDENLFYSLLNVIEQDNKYMIITSSKPIVYIDFSLEDLKSRLKNFLLLNIEKPDDELMFAILLKNLSDRQISIDKKLIDYTLKRIERSYRKIYNFIYKIDQLSLKRKKSIDLKIIKEVLGE